MSQKRGNTRFLSNILTPLERTSFFSGLIFIQELLAEPRIIHLDILNRIHIQSHNTLRHCRIERSWEYA